MIRRYIYFLKFHFFFILQTYKLIHKFLIIQLRIVFLIRRKSEVPDKVKETFYNLSYNGKSCQKTKLRHYRLHPQKNKFFLKFFKVFFKFFFIFSENVKAFRLKRQGVLLQMSRGFPTDLERLQILSMNQQILSVGGK